MSYERRIRIFLWLLSVPAFLLGAILLHLWNVSAWARMAAGLTFAVAWTLAVSLLLEQIARPLQTLANVIASLREDDYSFRARGGRRNDAVGDLALEVNALASMLQARRGGALEAMALLERVMSAMQSPVLAFAPNTTLRVVNAAAQRAFRLGNAALGRSAIDLHLQHLLASTQDELISMDQGYAPTRWIVQRSSFRLSGVPHTLLVLSDVSAALREEERLAWRRLIRVMGHEINNSLTPIKSIAGSLRAQCFERFHGDGHPDLERGLAIIENRAESLNRFLQAYSQLAGLPPPRLSALSIKLLLERVCGLETRLKVELQPGPEMILEGDADQLQQALINLVKNAAEAALSSDAARQDDAHQAGETGPGVLETGPWVEITWRSEPPDIVILIRDSGPGIANPDNLFVPFYTTKVDGTGIGLVLALQVFEAHHGTVRLRNRAERPGCEAEVRLPGRGGELA